MQQEHYLATFMPWSASLKRFSRVQDVGPIVQTILVFLNGVAALEMSGLHRKEVMSVSQAEVCFTGNMAGVQIGLGLHSLLNSCAPT